MHWKPLGLAALLVLLTVLAYYPAADGQFLWDDPDYVEKNPILPRGDGLWHIWFAPRASAQYYPLVFTGFWLEYRLWGLDPAGDPNPVGYHWVNILLHAANAVLVWRVLGRLAAPGAWFAAAIFALHPVHVESVAWITERKNVLSTFFYGLAFLSYLRFAPLDRPIIAGGATPTRRGSKGRPSVTHRLSNLGRAVFNTPGRWGWYALALLLFACALLSKTVTCSLPAALLLVAWWKAGRIAWKDVWPLLPFFAVGLVMALVTVRLETEHVGAEGEPWDFSLLDRFLIAGRALCFYAGKLAWPDNLTFIYPRWAIDATAWWQYLYPLAALAVLLCLWLARWRIGRGPLVAVLFFAGTLFPALGFFNVFPFLFSFVADHFQYLAGVGLIALAAAGFTQATQALHLPPWLTLAVQAGVLAGLGFLTRGANGCLSKPGDALDRHAPQEPRRLAGSLQSRPGAQWAGTLDRSRGGVPANAAALSAFRGISRGPRRDALPAPGHCLGQSRTHVRGSALLSAGLDTCTRECPESL